jgi:hypothetical protein
MDFEKYLASWECKRRVAKVFFERQDGAVI